MQTREYETIEVLTYFGHCDNNLIFWFVTVFNFFSYWNYSRVPKTIQFARLHVQYNSKTVAIEYTDMNPYRN